MLDEKKNRTIAYIILVVTALIWGGTWPLGRWLVSEEVGGETIPPLMIAVIRYFLAIICFFIFLKYREGSLHFEVAKKYWKLLTFMGLTSVVIYQIGYLFGEMFTAASDASILVATNAIWVIFIASIVLDKKFAKKRIIGTILAVFAVFLVVGFSPNVDVPNRILGDILILMAAFAYASYTVASRYFMNTVKEAQESYQPTSLWIITWVSFFGFLLITPIGLIFSPEYLNPVTYLSVPNRIWLGIFYLAFISTVGGYTFYLEGVKRLDASKAAIFQTLVPLFGVVLSALFLQEKFDFFIYPISLLLVITGIVLVNYEKAIKNEDTEKENLKKENINP
ncbi:MAG: putative DMT superfamily transporter inner membrane protein [Promethearchaeota archaeon]|nr:MAG: putative DMT superfamily transporter inner membrane protein [Candidatus Lokiarchaeota archaeon]